MANTLLSLLSDFVEIAVVAPGTPAHLAFYVPAPGALGKWSGFPAAARPEAGRAGCGRGLSLHACRESGLGEIVEIASCCGWPDECYIQASARDLGSLAIAPRALLGFSTGQMADRGRWNRAHEGIDWCPPPSDDTVVIDWCECTDALSGAVRYVPADHAIIGRRSPGDTCAVAVATSSGCAAGPSREAACHAALLELVERDAIGRWWHAARRRRQLDPAMIGIPDAAVCALSARERRTVLFDISTGNGVCVIAAASWLPDGTNVALGFKAHHELSVAATGAVLELWQIEIGLSQRLALHDPTILAWCATVTRNMAPLAATGTAGDPMPPMDPVTPGTLDRLHGALAADGIRVLYIDRTRPDFDVSVIRAIAPGLCGDRPRWGMSRLLGPDSRDLSPVPAFREGLPPNPIPLAL
jgi:ribosomal protein S12 methylthiotransferase accessory factor